jgi:hypothetical protein
MDVVDMAILESTEAAAIEFFSQLMVKFSDVILKICRIFSITHAISKRKKSHLLSIQVSMFCKYNGGKNKTMKRVILLAATAIVFSISAMEPSAPTESSEKESLASKISLLYDEFGAICKTNGADFDVHKFDKFVTSNLKLINEYLNECSALETSMELPQIEADMLQVINNSDAAIVAEYDLSSKHLERAFHVLQTAIQHKTLIPMFRQIYTFISNQKSYMKEFVVYSFISNVNKFKGSECFPGYRNRMVIDFLKSIAD